MLFWAISIRVVISHPMRVTHSVGSTRGNGLVAMKQEKNLSWWILKERLHEATSAIKEPPNLPRKAVPSGIPMVISTKKHRANISFQVSHAFPSEY